MYYCKARYYVPLWKRWLTPDNPKYLDGKDINNLNLFAYCGNDPINKYDPNGNSPKWLKTFTDIALYVVSGIFASIFAPVVASVTLPTPEVTLLGGLAVFGAINNFTNAIYYNHISDGESDLTTDSYRDEFINRWDRLDYTKSQNEMPSQYGSVASLYFAEYNFHALMWFFTNSQYTGKMGDGFWSDVAYRASKADVVVNQEDSDLRVKYPTRILRWLGL